MIKKIEELNISPYPWKVTPVSSQAACVDTSDGYEVCIDATRNDANLIVKSPEMYKVLFDLVDELNNCFMSYGPKLLGLKHRAEEVLESVVGEDRDQFNQHKK